jgi:hypothetical protein
MIDITNIHIHYVDFPRTTKEKELKRGKHHVKVIQPTNATNTLRIKQDIAEVLEQLKIKGNVEYYYVVFEIAMVDGSAAFRSVVPKQFLN